jgi:hypothetical protein
MNGNDFLMNFDIVIIGIAFTIGIEKLVQESSILAILNFCSFSLLALNFFYAKLLLLTEEKVKKQFISFGEFTFHILTLSIFAFIPYFLNNILGFIICQFALRSLDIILISISETTNCNDCVNKIENRWIYFDIGIFIYFIAVYLFEFNYLPSLTTPYISFPVIQVLPLSVIPFIIFIVIVIFEIGFDFFVNRKEYKLLF